MKLDYNILNNIKGEIGDAWYILDIERFRDNYREFSKAFKDIYPSTKISYSYKTNYIPDLCKVVDDEGGYAEVVSEMEYDLAISIGVNPTKIIVNGPYKPALVLEKFLISGSLVNFDSYAEIEDFEKILIKYPKKSFKIGLRCNFELGETSKSRFGFDIEDEKFYTMIDKLRKFDNMELSNLHCHFPSREVHLFGDRVDRMLKLYRRIQQNDEIKSIDLGGGLGGRLHEYVRKQLNYKVADYQDYADIIATKFKKEFSNDKVKPTLLLEPGTSLVADTMKFVSSVVEIKKIRGDYFAITSGTKVNFQPMASNLNMPIDVYGDEKKKRQCFHKIDISGYTCMENDYLFKNYVGELSIGDFVVLSNVGSYSIVFKPPFILPNVPVVSLNNDSFKIIKEAETIEHIFQTYKYK